MQQLPVTQIHGDMRNSCRRFVDSGISRGRSSFIIHEEHQISPLQAGYIRNCTTVLLHPVPLLPGIGRQLQVRCIHEDLADEIRAVEGTRIITAGTEFIRCSQITHPRCDHTFNHSSLPGCRYRCRSWCWNRCRHRCLNRYRCWSWSGWSRRR